MAKLKLKELALELGIENDAAKKILTDNGRESNYSRLTIASALEDEDIELIRKEAAKLTGASGSVKKENKDKPAKTEAVKKASQKEDNAGKESEGK